METGQAAAAAAPDHNQYLIFALAEETFAMTIRQVREIIEYDNVTTVPMMPAFVKGVINLRGSVVPVIDLSARFGREPCAIQRRTCIIIMEIEHEGMLQELGIVVDAVSAVMEIPTAEIEPPPPFGANIRTDFISGMGKIKDRFVIILDIDKVLGMDEMAMLARLSAQEDAHG